MQNSKKDQSSSSRGRPVINFENFEEWFEEQKKQGYKDKVEIFANFIRSDYVVGQKAHSAAKFFFTYKNLNSFGLDDDPDANAALFCAAGVIKEFGIDNRDIRSYRDANGNTILHLVIHNTYRNAMVLFFSTIDVNDFSITNNNGQTPLDIAESLGTLDDLGIVLERIKINSLRRALERIKEIGNRADDNDRTSEADTSEADTSDSRTSGSRNPLPGMTFYELASRLSEASLIGREQRRRNSSTCSIS